jgi:hypothetical protein
MIWLNSVQVADDLFIVGVAAVIKKPEQRLDRDYET